MSIDTVCSVEHKIQFSFIANPGQILMMMMNPMMEIQSFKVMIAKKTQWGIPTLSVLFPGLHV